MVKLAPDRLVRALKDDAGELHDVVRTMPEIDADADKKKLEAALRLARAMVSLLGKSEQTNVSPAIAGRSLS